MNRREKDEGEQSDDRSGLGDTFFARKARATMSVISEKTSIPFRIIVPLSVMLIASTVKISSGIHKIEAALAQQWDVDSMDKFARLLQRDNPALRVPDVRELQNSRKNPNLQLIP